MVTQAQRSFEINTPLGKDVLLLQRMSGTEALSEPYLWELDLLSEKGDVQAEDILGQKVCITFTSATGKKRYFHGIVTQFSQGGWLQHYYQYKASVRPWYWLLTHTADCRAYQEMSVPQIFEEVVKQYGFSDYELRLSGSYPTREYCVQYRESDLNFLSRLLEHEGIYFFFEHTESKHTLVLIDDPGQHKPFEGYETVPYYAPGGKDTLRERDHLESWTYTKTIQPGSYATTDFDFEVPRKSLAGSATISREHPHASFEIFDYPGALAQLESHHSEAISKVRIQELHAGYMVASGRGNAAGLSSGHRFTLEKFPRKDLNMTYLVTRAAYTLSNNVYESGPVHDTLPFEVSIDAIDARTPFRAARRAEKPMIHGAQTAMVVGPAGEEIHTDKHGRVKVQFPWDRYGKQDEQSSCWVRVAQQWAGKGWGMINVPRIGQEVIVTFLEGDPDRPIITGRVYNGDSMSPYGLPGSATQSGIRSRSSKGGSEANFNEVSFEDLKGSELLAIHAEKDHKISVENDENHSVGHDRNKTIANDEQTHVGRDRVRTVGNNESIAVTANRTRSVGINEDVKIGANRSHVIGANDSTAITSNRSKTVGGNETTSVALMRTHSVGVNEMINVGVAQETNVGGAHVINVGAAQTISVVGEQLMTVGFGQTTTVVKHRSVTVGGGQTHAIKGARTATVGKDDHLTVTKDLVINAGDSVSITTGHSSITMKKDGTITIKGKDITIEASGKHHVTAKGNVVVKGAKIEHN